MHIGIMQGRLSNKPGQPLQSFPWNTWKKEFLRAHSIGFNQIEWLVDDAKNNPIASFTDCIGVENGLAVLDDCGTCHQSYIYDSYTHIPTYINDTLGLVLGATEMLILAGSPEEKITEGLDGLRERLQDYYKLGARFTKWRGVYNISNKYPSKLSIHSNAHALARYSKLVQECGMVPIVEPEVLMDGDHSAEVCLNKTSEVIKRCFEELLIHKIDLSGIILKPNMILAGTTSNKKISSEEVAKLTLKCLKENVPSEIPGIAFLSGGQTEIEATENLNLINKYNNTNFIMTYSYGRALQKSALKFWSKDIKDTHGTQKVFNHRANMCTLAAQGKWSAELETK